MTVMLHRKLRVSPLFSQFASHDLLSEVMLVWPRLRLRRIHPIPLLR